MKVEIIKGDLLNQEVDVIVNPWNRNFIPWFLLLPQGVSGQLKKQAGLKPFNELLHYGLIKLGEAVLTGPGKLPIKGIIHVAGLTWYWVATEQSIRLSTSNAVLLAAEKGFKSIALPLIGAGTGGKKRDRVKQIMLEEIARLEYDLQVIIVEKQ